MALTLGSRTIGVVGILCALLPGCPTSPPPGKPVPPWRPGSIVVVATPDDPYRPLAREIAEARGAPIVADLESATREAPEFLLWVAAPQSLSDAAIVEAGRHLADASSSPSLGIVTGSSLESARGLWRRGDRAESDTLVAIRGEYPAHGIGAPRLLEAEAGGADRIRELEGRQVTPAVVGAALVRADYLEFRGHGGSNYWRLTPDTVFGPGDLPRLDGAVVDSWGCSTLRPWTDGSIALAMVDRGAAAYAGFAYSGVAGYGFQGFPLRHTWPGFPSGHVVRLQNAAAEKGYAAFPFYFVLGDPRLAFGDRPPYRLVEGDGADRNAREPDEGVDGLTYRVLDAPPGWLPVRIPDGADFPAVRVRTPDRRFLTWETEPLYDARIQIGDAGPDRLILLKHDGGDLEIDLLRRVPTGPAVVKTTLGAVDHVWIHLAAGDGGLLLSILGAVLLIGHTAWTRRRGDVPGLARRGLVAALAGLVLGGAHAAWVLSRLDSIWINSKPVVGIWPAIFGTAVFGAAGMLVVRGSRTRWRRPLGLLIGSLPAWFPALFALGVVAGSRLVLDRIIGASPYGFAFARPALLGAAPILALVVIVLLTAERIAIADGAAANE